MSDTSKGTSSFKDDSEQEPKTPQNDNKKTNNASELTFENIAEPEGTFLPKASVSDIMGVPTKYSAKSARSAKIRARFGNCVWSFDNWLPM